MLQLDDKKTKIIATLGPACDSKEGLQSIIEAGVDIIRLNASHNANPAFIKEKVQLIRSISRELVKPICIFVDLQGPKIRIGQFADGKVELLTGQEFRLTSQEVPGTDKIASLSYPGLIQDVKVGDPVYIDDGSIRLSVIEKTDTELVCQVLQGGPLSNYKGVNLPQTKISSSAFTEKDKTDIHLAVENNLEYVALSFVSVPDDIHLFRAYLNELGGHKVKIIAKIERQLAIDHIIPIIEAADAIMVARGDLGVEIGVEKVPEAQKMIIRESNRRIKPVIVATQMLETMIYKKNATRAEVSDVANAIYDRCDAVMLSGETAVGIDPTNVVQTMKTICLATDKHMIEIKRRSFKSYKTYFVDHTVSTSFATAADQIAEENKASALMVFTSSGSTPLISCKLNPVIPIIATTDDEQIYNQMMLYRGVRPLLLSKKFTEMVRWSDMIKVALEDVKRLGILKTDDTIVVTAGIPIGHSGGTNSVRLVKVP